MLQYSRTVTIPKGEVSPNTFEMIGEVPISLIFMDLMIPVQVLRVLRLIMLKYEMFGSIFDRIDNANQD